MKLLLTSRYPENVFSPSFVEKKCISLLARISIPPNPVKTQTDFLNKQLQSFKDIYPNKEWILSTEFRFYDLESPKLDIALEGELLKNLHDILYYGSNKENLHVNITASYSAVIPGDMLLTPPTQGVLLAKGMEVDTSCNVIKHFRYSKKEISLPETIVGGVNWNSTILFKWGISVELELNDMVNLTGLLPQVSEKNARILEEKLFCDFEIISSDEISIQCHKAMISTSSDMFMAKCEGKLNEPSKNQMTMDLTGESVIALLEFIYCGNVHKPMQSSRIAFELFQAGHKYGIVGLEPVMVAILLQKSIEWYDVDVAFDLFRFMVNYEGESKSELTKKVVEALARKSDELNDCGVVQETFSQFPALAIQLFAMMAQDIKNRLTTT